MNFVFNNQIPNIIAPRVVFKSNSTYQTTPIAPRKDSFNSNPLYDSFRDKNYIANLAKSNPKIRQTLTEHKIPLKVNIDELEKLKQGHLLDTRVTAAKIYSALPADIKSKINQTDLQQAAMLHDYGKVLIPKEILNKKTTLTPDEKAIMELHSSLGADLLEQQGVKKEVTDLIRYHHQNLKGTGYPKIDKGFEYSYPSQILYAADKYSALRENRSYKAPMTKEDAINILSKDVSDGYINTEILDALKKIV